MASEPLIVQAIYSFKGSNNDELCFKKGDLIAVTQKDEGWWEGTLNGKTGWFPCNYVKECQDAPKPVLQQQNQYKSVVLKDLIDSEKAHVTELEGLVSNFLQPLEKTNILNIDEYKQLTGNILEVLETHQQLLKLIEAEEAKPGLEQRVGKLFMTWAVRMKNVHQTYCALHPKAVCILDKYKDELTNYMESRGATSPGVLVLTTLLSKPFRRLDKYSGMLQELERHIEECHPDRGDTQRCVSIYKEIATSCSATRRQKELELQVLTGPIKGLEGPSLSTLGDVIYMGSVAVGPQHHDRYYVLFANTLLILSVSKRLSSFIYEGKLPLSGMLVKRLEDSEQYKNAFEISTSMTETRIAVCQSKQEANHWVDLLKRQMNVNCKVGPLQAQYVPQHQTNTPQVVAATTPNVRHVVGTINNIVNNNNNGAMPPTVPPHGFSATSLRASPPLRPCISLDQQLYSRPNHKYSAKSDATILDVIEAYISAVKPRNTANSVDVSNWMKNSDKNNVLDHLQSKLAMLEQKLTNLSSELNEEKQMRCALQTIVKNYLTNNCKDSDKIEWPTMESNI